jgi:hypothetical protein
MALIVRAVRAEIKRSPAMLESELMTEPDPSTRRQVQADVAALAGTIERAAGDLAMAEEPSGFAAVLEAAAPRD